MTLPFVGKPRDAHQSLADIELVVTRCMAVLQIPGSIRVLFSTPIPPHVNVRPGKELACKLIGDLDDWAIAYPHLTSVSKSSWDAPAETGTSKSPRRQPSNSDSPDTFVALIASNYIADRLVMNMLMYKMHTESTAPMEPYENTTAHYYGEATKAAVDILEAATEIEKAQSPGFDLLRSIAPVMAVAFAAPTLELRKDAVDMMQRWAGKIGGLGSVITAI
jgi:hypothetical protein